MNREIKFRAKWVHGVNEFVYGYLVKVEDEYCLIDSFYDTIMNEYYHLEPEEIYEVQQGTIGQYVGLKDKNGREIYEGDIVTLNSKSTLIVVFDDFMWQLQKNGKSLHRLEKEDEIKIEVVGNIYDNQHLLEIEN